VNAVDDEGDVREVEPGFPTAVVQFERQRRAEAVSHIMALAIDELGEVAAK